LNERGLKQVEALGLRLKNEKIQAVYSSPLQRAYNTAKAIAGHHGLMINTIPELKEMNVGNLEGVLSATLGKRFDLYMCRDSSARLAGGECLQEVQERAWRVMTGLRSKHEDQTIVVVTHYFVVMTLVCKVLDLPLVEMSRLMLKNASISSIVLDGPDNTRLETFNDVCHINV